MLTRAIVLCAFLAHGLPACHGSDGCLSIEYSNGTQVVSPLEVVEGTQLNLTCACRDSNSSLSYGMWLITTVNNETAMANRSLSLNLELSSSGEYMCIFENDTALLNVTVILAPISKVAVTVDPGPKAPVGGAVTFNCAVDKPGMSPVQYTWSVNNTVLASEASMTFTIVNLTMEGGSYTCNASNNISNVASNQIELQPYQIESLTILSSTNEARIGENVTLSCTAILSSTAPSNTEVMFNVSEGASTVRYNATSIHIFTSGVSTARVVCAAALNGSSRIVDDSVNVLRYVTFSSPNDAVENVTAPFEVNQTCSVELTGDVPANRTISYSWSLSDRIISDNDSLVQVLDKTNVERVFTCTATVDGIEFTSTYTARVIGPPGPVSNISSMLAGLTAVEVSWLPPKGEIMNIISYSVEVTCGAESFNFSNDANSQNVRIEGLPRNTNCSVNISATNNNGSGPVTTYQFHTASPANTAVTMLKGTFNDPLTLTVSWMVPSGLEGVNATFTVFYTPGSRVLTEKTNNTSVKLDVLPNTTYTVHVQAVYEGNFTSDNTTAKIESGLLFTSNLSNTVGNVTSSPVEGDNRSYNISWTTIDPMEGSVSDRLLSTYRVTYSPVPSAGRRKRQASSVKKSIDVMRNETSVTLKNLNYFTNYKYDVSGVYRVNGVEIQVPGPPGSFKTGEGAPEEPEGLAADNGKFHLLLLTWKEPTNPNGVITVYTIMYGNSLINTTGNATSFNLTGLNHSTEYAVSVRANTRAGQGKVAMITTHTRILFIPGNITDGGGNHAEQTVRITIPRVETYGDEVSELYIFVVKGSDDSSKDSRHRAQLRSYSESSNIYVAARYITRPPFPFTLGDRRRSRGREGMLFYNAPLERGNSYRVFVRYYSNLDSTQHFETGLSPVIIINPEPDYTAVIIAVIVVLVILIIAVLILIAVLLYCFRRQPSPYHHANHHSNFVHMPSFKKTKHPYLTIEEPLVMGSANMPTLLYVEVMTDDATVKWVKEGEELKDDRFKVLRGGSLYITKTYLEDAGSYTVIATNGHGAKEGTINLQVLELAPPEPDPKHPVIKVEDLMETIALLRREDGEGFSDEFQSLDLEWDVTTQHARAPCNAGKNRFINISPYDHSRVVLSSDSAEPGSDYINASFLDGYKKTKNYIASQGPTASSIDDFWRMIWQNNVPTIVMVTKLEEGRERLVVKCNQYWPEAVSIPRLYGNIKVTMTEEEELALYCVRTFSVQEYGNEESTREVRQFHFLAWPDHGVPEYATAILSFRQRIRQYHDRSNAGPMVVHCSAGVGRTGTFVTIDTNIEMIEAEGKVDVFNFVRGLRWRRNYMVQTEPQYVFIYDALEEYHNCGDTSVVATNLKKQLNALQEKNEKTGLTGYEEQYQKLASVCPKEDTFDFTVALMSSNVSKNRSKNLLPPDDILVPLNPNSSKQGYINATYLDGYRQLKAFITTQTPLTDTLKDFWQMIWEQKCHAIISMEEVIDNEKEMSVQYWPSVVGETKQYGSVTVELVSEDPVNSDYVVRKLKIWRENKEEECRNITQFHYTDWPEGGCPGNAGSLIELINDVQRVQRKSGNHPITIQCANGVSRSGALCALMTALERVKTEQIVDVFRAVKSLRIQRPGIVESVEQYKFIHDGILQYLTTFEGYSNFA